MANFNFDQVNIERSDVGDGAFVQQAGGPRIYTQRFQLSGIPNWAFTGEGTQPEPYQFWQLPANQMLLRMIDQAQHGDLLPRLGTPMARRSTNAFVEGKIADNGNALDFSDLDDEDIPPVKTWVGYEVILKEKDGMQLQKATIFSATDTKITFHNSLTSFGAPIDQNGNGNGNGNGVLWIIYPPFALDYSLWFCVERLVQSADGVVLVDCKFKNPEAMAPPSWAFDSFNSRVHWDTDNRLMAPNNVWPGDDQGGEPAKYELVTIRTPFQTIPFTMIYPDPSTATREVEKIVGHVNADYCFGHRPGTLLAAPPTAHYIGGTRRTLVNYQFLVAPAGESWFSVLHWADPETGRIRAAEPSLNWATTVLDDYPVGGWTQAGAQRIRDYPTRDFSDIFYGMNYNDRTEDMYVTHHENYQSIDPPLSWGD